jgi:hypothetical protein
MYGNPLHLQARILSVFTKQIPRFAVSIALGNTGYHTCTNTEYIRLDWWPGTPASFKNGVQCFYKYRQQKQISTIFENLFTLQGQLTFMLCLLTRADRNLFFLFLNFKHQFFVSSSSQE